MLKMPFNDHQKQRLVYTQTLLKLVTGGRFGITVYDYAEDIPWGPKYEVNGLAEYKGEIVYTQAKVMHQHPAELEWIKIQVMQKLIDAIVEAEAGA